MRGGTADAPLTHQIEGSGETVLLLNGGLMSVAAWEPIAHAIRRSHEVVRCDFRGQLLSPGEPPATLEGHATDAAALLDTLGRERVNVVGTSFGAEVGLLLAATRPERVASLAAITATDRVTPDAWTAALPLLQACREAAAGGDGARVFDLLLPGTFSPAYLNAQAALLRERRQQIAAFPAAWFAGLAGLLGALEGLDLTPQLGRIRCPTLVVAAERDLTFPPERSDALAAAIPGAVLTVVPGSGHALVAEAPGRLVEILDSFLANLAAGGAYSSKGGSA